MQTSNRAATQRTVTIPGEPLINAGPVESMVATHEHPALVAVLEIVQADGAVAAASRRLGFLHPIRAENRTDRLSRLLRRRRTWLGPTRPPQPPPRGQLVERSCRRRKSVVAPSSEVGKDDQDCQDQENYRSPSEHRILHFECHVR